MRVMLAGLVVLMSGCGPMEPGAPPTTVTIDGVEHVAVTCSARTYEDRSETTITGDGFELVIVDHIPGVSATLVREGEMECTGARRTDASVSYRVALTCAGTAVEASIPFGAECPTTIVD